MTEDIHWTWADEGGMVPPDDRGFAYGQGVFETIRVDSRGLLLEGYHRDRLLHGCRSLGIAFGGADFDRWRSEARKRGLLECPGGAKLLKLTVTAGSGGRGYRMPTGAVPRVITATTPLPAPPVPGDAVRVRRCQQCVRINPERQGLKSLERLDQVLASMELDTGDFEGLMCDSRGYPVEGTRTNILVPMGERLVTPPATQLAVAGTLRSWLKSALPGLGWRLEEQELTSAMIRENGLLLGNSVMGLVNATMLDDEPLPVGRSAKTLREEVNLLLGLN